MNMVVPEEDVRKCFYDLFVCGKQRETLKGTVKYVSKHNHIVIHNNEGTIDPWKKENETSNVNNAGEME